MADRQDGYGFTAECQEIIQGKWDQGLGEKNCFPIIFGLSTTCATWSF